MSEFERRSEPQYQRPMSTPPQPPRPTPTHTSVKAVFAFLFGFLSFGFWIFASLPAFILALQAKSDIRRDGNLKGRGLANIGLFFSISSFFLLPIFIVVVFIANGSFNFGTESYDDDYDRIVHLHLSGGLPDAPDTDPYASFGAKPITLRNMVDAIEEASYDESVLALVVTMDYFQTSLAQVEELRAAFDAFLDEEKAIYVHSEEASMSTGTYALFSGATHFNVVPTGTIDLVGMFSEGIYLKDGLDEIGIQADVVHIGDYKSAGEMVMRNEPSPAAEEAMNWMMDSLYESLVDMIAESREFTMDEVRALIDAGPYTAAQAEKAGLIDSRMYLDELRAQVEDEYGEDVYFDNNYEGLFDTAADAEFEWFPTADDNYADQIGLIYLQGAIMPGYGQSGAYSGTIRRALDAAAKDDSVSAVVIRVNSPGGSVTASEVILRGIQQLNEKKPVVISMGDVAASGGYYVACQADAIFANETTITGSIGVVGGKIVTRGMWDELGIHWYPYKRGENSNWTSGAEPFNAAQRANITESMGAAYTTFKDHVMTGREDRLVKELEDMAGGRVFTGKQALELGLIDEIGGLDDAIYYAADLVDLDSFDVKVIPEPIEFGEAIMQEFFGGGDRPTDMSLDPLTRTNALDSLRDAATNRSIDAIIAQSLMEKFDPARGRAMVQLVQSAELIRQQGVVAIMPEVVVVH